jgi:hypothetical protein
MTRGGTGGGGGGLLGGGGRGTAAAGAGKGHIEMRDWAGGGVVKPCGGRPQ